jgi:hypothetical protein
LESELDSQKLYLFCSSAGGQHFKTVITNWWPVREVGIDGFSVTPVLAQKGLFALKNQLLTPVPNHPTGTYLWSPIKNQASEALLTRFATVCETLAKRQFPGGDGEEGGQEGGDGKRGT